MKQELFTYGDYSYKYFILRRNRKTVSLTVQPSLNIILKCPYNYSPSHVEKFLKRKWHWIEKQLRDFRRFQRKHLTQEYISGEALLYLGRQYQLIVKAATIDQIKIERGKIRIDTTHQVTNSERNRTLLENWYQERADRVLRERYREVLKRFDYGFVPKLTIRRMPKRWGSFVSKKSILLNPELIKAPKECIDYVITHELCHMKYKNHSQAFFRLLQSKVPNWKEVKEKLELRFL